MVVVKRDSFNFSFSLFLYWKYRLIRLIYAFAFILRKCSVICNLHFNRILCFYRYKGNSQFDPKRLFVLYRGKELCKRNARRASREIGELRKYFKFAEAENCAKSKILSFERDR